MGITDRKEREKLEMRRLIIDAAMQMFVTDGYEKTSIRNIADKIEYSPATIYLYYKDKDELLYEVQAEAFSRLYKYFLETVTAKAPIKRLEQIAKAYIAFGMKHPDLYDLMFIIRSPMNAVDDKPWTNGDECFMFLVNCIEECKDLIRYKDKKVAILSLWSMVHGLISLDIRCRIKIMEMSEGDVQKLIEKSVDEYIRLIKV